MCIRDRLSIQLKVNGINPIAISMDDYFINRCNCPVDEEGNPDLESVETIDIPLFNDHISRLCLLYTSSEAGLEIFDTYKEVLDEAVHLKRQNEPPESEKSLNLDQKWWNMLLTFTGGDMNIIPQLEAFNGNKGNWNNELAEKQQEIDDYFSAILNCYLSGMEKE